MIVHLAVAIKIVEGQLARNKNLFNCPEKIGIEIEDMIYQVGNKLSDGQLCRAKLLAALRAESGIYCFFKIAIRASHQSYCREYTLRLIVKLVNELKRRSLITPA